MTKVTFLLLLILYFIVFSIRNNILKSFHRKNELLWLSETFLTYIFVVLFIILMVAGMLFTPKDQYKQISKKMEKIRNSDKRKRPHRYFDIDTYKDSPPGI